MLGLRLRLRPAQRLRLEEVLAGSGYRRSTQRSTESMEQTFQDDEREVHEAEGRLRELQGFTRRARSNVLDSVERTRLLDLNLTRTEDRQDLPERDGHRDHQDQSGNRRSASAVAPTAGGTALGTCASCSGWRSTWATRRGFL
jgi:hypothetical protein